MTLDYSKDNDLNSMHEGGGVVVGGGWWLVVVGGWWWLVVGGGCFREEFSVKSGV